MELLFELIKKKTEIKTIGELNIILKIYKNNIKSNKTIVKKKIIKYIFKNLNNKIELPNKLLLNICEIDVHMINYIILNEFKNVTKFGNIFNKWNDERSSFFVTLVCMSEKYKLSYEAISLITYMVGNYCSRYLYKNKINNLLENQLNYTEIINIFNIYCDKSFN